MYKLIGYQQKKGNFTNKDTGELVEYNNVELFYCTDEKPGVKGLFCDSARAKMDDLKFTGCKSLDEALNKDCYLIADLTAKADEEGKTRMLVSRIVVL